jgi:uncharacterized protein YgiM (DUF1202 family)
MFSRSFLKPPVVAVLCVLLLSACESMGNKEGWGTTIGAGLGGVIGSQFGHGSGRLVATGLGVAIGGFVGNRIGAYLDEQDKQRMTASMQAAAVTGQSQSWSNPRSGASGSVTVTGQRTSSGEVNVPVLKDRVQEVPPLDLIGATYKATGTANVRGGPGSDYKTTGSLKAGQAVNVIGKVQGADWYLISEGEAASGFVYARLLAPAPEATVAAASGPKGETGTAVVQAKQTCQITTTSVKYADGRVEKKELMLCPSADGSMEVRES